ncbi:flagellar filament capping protein FliD [Natroniella sp. ANB-PHB2]|uniref:flagellar filament capping protein FliD n=1 Tax=Natroniella sp. ANB-PHB2 TaxID=3384444 RepID=UPI0038D4B56F
MSTSFGGLASGIDTNSMVRQLMYLEEAPIRNLEERQENINDQVDAWQKVNSSLDSFKNKASALEDVFDEIGANSSDEEVLTASARSTAAEGTYEIEVTELAVVERVATKQIGEDGIDLGEDAEGNQIETGTLNINGQDITINDGDSVTAIRDKINDIDDAEVTASIVDGRLVIAGDNMGAENRIGFDATDGVILGTFGLELEGGYVKETEDEEAFNPLLQQAADSIFTVNGLEIERADREIDDVIEGVTLDLKDKGSSTLEVQVDIEGMREAIDAFVSDYNSLRDRLDQYGGKEAILQGDATLNRITSNLYNSIMYPSTTLSSLDRLSDSSMPTAGNLQIEFAEGKELTFEFDDSITVDNLLEKIEGQSTGLDVEFNDDEQLLVKDGGELLSTIDIESNNLVIDSNLSEPVNLSGSDTEVLDGLNLNQKFEKNALSLVGIEIDRHGKLSVNSSTLEENIEDNLGDIKQLFTGANGIVERVEAQIDLATDRFDGYVGNRIDSLESTVRHIDDDIERIQMRLERREDRLFRQFSRMEQALSEMQNQGSWLSAQIGSLGLM